MRKINISQVSEAAQHSPKGTFAVFRKHISIALGGLKDVGVFGGGHPFDLELVRVPSGRAAWPLHSHSAPMGALRDYLWQWPGANAIRNRSRWRWRRNHSSARGGAPASEYWK